MPESNAIECFSPFNLGDTMKRRHNLWPSLREVKKIAREKKEAKKELQSLIDKHGKNLLLDYSGGNHDA